MLRFRSLLFDFLMYGTMLVYGILMSPLALWSVDGAYWVAKRYCRIVFWYLKVVCNLRVEIRGPVPSGNVVVCSKHMSFLDILMLMEVLPRAKFIMKRQLVFAPVVGFYALRIGSAPVTRGKKGGALIKMVSQMQESQKKDAGQTVIFPQGTRVLPGVSRPYKVGAAVLYERFGQDCAPAATNTGVFWSRRSPYRKPGVAILEFLPIIKSGKPVKEFIAELEALVETNSNRLMAEAGFDFDAVEKT